MNGRYIIIFLLFLLEDNDLKGAVKRILIDKKLKKIRIIILKKHMIIKKLFIISILFNALFLNCLNASELNAKIILDSVDDLYRSNSSHGILSLAVVTTNWQRTLILEQWSKDHNKHLIKVLKPKKEKGLATLRFKNNIWNYMPKVKRVVKIPSSMMSSSWMGSHFTNDDLVKQSRMAIDYNFSITHEGIKDGIDIIEISCIPKRNAAVVWGKVEVIVYRENFIPLNIIYYDEELKLSRKLEFSNIQTLSGKKIPLQMQMFPADEPDESTTVQWKEIKFDLTISDDFFSLRKLQE